MDEGRNALSRRTMLGATAATLGTAAALGYGVADPPGAGAATSNSENDGSGTPAAVIKYKTTPRPAGLPDSFVAPDGVNLTFLAINAIDGFVVEGAFFEPKKQAATAIIKVHGSGANFTEIPYEGPRLSSAGYGVLAINTRQHDQFIDTDNLMDIRKDIEAAFYTALSRGYQNIVLDGHSLGTVQVAFYAAHNWDLRIKGVILAAAFANLPWKSRNVLIQDEDLYAKLYSEAVQFLAEGKQADVLPTLMKGGGGNPNNVGPVTAQHFLSYRREFASAADTTYWIRKVPRPVLMIRGTQDQTILNFEPNWILESATRSEGTICPSLKFVAIPGATHGLSENPDAVIAAELAFLQGLGL